MAVYTAVSAELLAAFLTGYDVGALTSFKGIAEGVENSNYLVDTSGNDGAGARFILTLYEKRVAAADLPWFLALMTHLADAGLPVPRPVADRAGRALQTLAGRPACLIEFRPGVSVSDPTPAQARAVGAALAAMHAALITFTPVRDNALGPAGWARLAAACGDSLDSIRPGLRATVTAELADLAERWPRDLPRSAIHADLFPDNVLVRDATVTGIIDLYFACSDLRAYDLAVTHTAWSFDTAQRHRPAIGDALLAGYGALLPAERAALPILCRGACLRFLLTRAYDWINTPAGALVTRKDPLAYLARLEHYRAWTT